MSEYKLEFNYDIVSTTTDDASVMVKFTENTNVDFEIYVEEIFDMKTELEKAIQSFELKQEVNKEDLSTKSVNKEFSVFK